MALKWIAADIDGTILDSSSRLPPENVYGDFARLKDRGVEVVLVTGRRYGAAVWVAERPGVVLSTHRQQRRHDRVPGSVAAVGPVVSGARGSDRHTVRHLELYALHRSCTRTGRPRGRLVVCSQPRTNGQLHHYLNKVPGVTVQVESLQSEVDGDLIEIMFSGPLGVMEAVEGRLKESGFEKHARIAKTYYREKDLGIIDVLNRDCSKRSALDFLARSRGIRPAEIMAIGDNHSDLEMLEYAGCGGGDG